jgi:hypothetical protein
MAIAQVQSISVEPSANSLTFNVVLGSLLLTLAGSTSIPATVDWTYWSVAGQQNRPAIDSN